MSKQFSIALLFVVAVLSAVGAKAAPTISVNPLSEHVDTHLVTGNGSVGHAVETLVSEYNDPALATAAIDFLLPSADTRNSIDAICPQSLPAIPRGVLMAVAGFLCVTLVKDRRAWLAVFGVILWIASAGIELVPQLTRISSQKIKELAVNVRTHVEDGSQFVRLRSDVEGSTFIGLLDHLNGLKANDLPALRLCSPMIFMKTLPNTGNTPQLCLSSIVTRLFAHICSLPLDCKEFVCFSSAFIFNTLARGPPMLSYHMCFVC